MWKWWAVSGLALVLAILALDEVTPAVAQSWAVSDRGFRVTWEPAETKRGTVIRGYVNNDLGTGATNLRFIIESLDAAGQVAATTIGYPQGTVGPSDRLYFEVPLKAPASSYRVRLAAWDPVGRGGM